LLGRQAAIDAGWPPAYARELDGGQWLAAPADLMRWVALGEDGAPIGHIGLGSVRDPAIAALVSAHEGSTSHAEICRLVVDPDSRTRGLAGVLTRRALRGAIEAGHVPFATVLTSRGSWLDMMCATGWRTVGRVVARDGVDELVVLLAPDRFVAQARQRNPA
jgi:GNAT superfamily N-acetyltransferase